MSGGTSPSVLYSLSSMIAQLYQFQNLPENYKQVLNQTLEPNQIVYVIKDNNNTPKSITTSVIQAIKKVQK